VVIAGGIGVSVTELLLTEGGRLAISYRANRKAGRWQGAATIVQADLASQADRRRLLNTATSLYALVVLSSSIQRSQPTRSLRASVA
jgi:uncharacterized protein YbjT (DUF2867 family)